MRKQIILYASVLILWACNTSTNENKSINKGDVLQEVKSTEASLFDLLNKGSINEAFALHDNQPNYKNISDGFTRTYTQMDSVLKSNSAKGIKSYTYQIQKRDFLVIDANNALETIEGDRILKDTADKIVENKGVTMSLLWIKTNDKWKLAYLHSSYKN